MSPAPAHDRPPRLVRPLRAGLTLIELMVALIIVAILVALALPSVLESLTNRRVYDAAHSVSGVFKSQRYRAQNLNRAVGVVVEDDGTVLTYVSTDNTCTGVGGGTATTAIEMATDFPDARINDSAFVGQVICIRPDGSVVDPDSGQPFANGPVRFLIGRADGIGNSHNVVVPYSGIARLD